MNTHTVRIGLIGAGPRTSGAHYPTLKRIPGVEIAGIADPDLQQAHALGDRLNIARRYADPVAMMEREKPDAVYVLMLPHRTWDIACAAIEIGCHLFLKEPPGITAEQCRHLANLARKHDVLTGVPFFRRFSPLIRKGKAFCEASGPVHSAVVTFYKHAMNGKPYYGGSVEILGCDAIHAVDTLRYLCGGNVESVASDVRRLNAAHRNAHYALVKFSTGATGVLLTNWQAGKRLFSAEIHSPGRSFFTDPEAAGRLFSDGKLEPVQTLMPSEAGPVQDIPPSFGIYDINCHFIDCIRRKIPPETNFDDALKTMELVERILQPPT